MPKTDQSCDPGIYKLVSQYNSMFHMLALTEHENKGIYKLSSLNFSFIIYKMEIILVWSFIRTWLSCM